MIQKIRAKDLVVTDDEIVDFIKNNDIRHLKLMAGFDYSAYLYLIYPDYKKELTLSRDWLNIRYRNYAISVRTPSMLRQYVGNNINIVRDKSSKERRLELFKIRPIDFEFEGLFNGFYKKIKTNIPYFTKSGHFVIPQKFANDNIGEAIDFSRISFDRVNNELIERGYIFCRLVSPTDKSGFTYPLSKRTNGHRTRQLVELQQKLEIYGKNMINFKYKTTTHDDDNHYDLIVFEEISFES